MPRRAQPVRLVVIEVEFNVGELCGFDGEARFFFPVLFIFQFLFLCDVENIALVGSRANVGTQFDDSDGRGLQVQMCRGAGNG